MSGLSAFEPQLFWVKKFNNTLKGSFTLDDINTVDKYVGKTELKAKFIYDWLKNQRRLAMDFPTHPQYYNVKHQFTVYLDSRIETLEYYLFKENQQIKQDSAPNLWKKGLNDKEAQHKELLEAAMYIQDLLFGCREVLETLPEQAESFINDQLTPFIENSLPAYLKLLPSSLKEESKFQIIESFENLKDLMYEKSFEKAKQLLAIIEEQIKGEK